MKNIIIKNGVIVTSKQSYVSDILIEGTKIVQISENIEKKDAIIIDASKKYVFPGAIDPHVHFNLKTPAGITADNFVTGSKAAIYGGTTTVIDFVTPEKGEKLTDALIKRKKEASGAKTNVFFHVSPIEWTNTTAQEMRECVENFGIKSFKVYMAYKSGIGLNDNVLMNVLEVAKELGVLVTAHCENDEAINYLRTKFISEGKTEPKYHPLSRPETTEAEAINRIITLAEIVDTPLYIVHVSTKLGIETIEKAQKRGVKVFAETCPHYLLLDDSVYNQEINEASKFVLSPPIRKKTDQLALWKAIQNGVVQTIGTDHCSFNVKGQKDLGRNDFTKIANGAGGVEHRLELLYTYGITNKKIENLSKMVEITASNPAKIFGLKNKGDIKVGYDADIVIWNPKSKKVISHKNHIQNCDNNIFEGFETEGKAEIVILGGEIVKS